MKPKNANIYDRCALVCGFSAVPFIRVALFVVYFWFGILKILGTSPANPLVADLLEKTLPFLTFEQFIVPFALFEMLIGTLFLFHRFDRVVIFLFGFHMFATFLPLVLLPQVAWSGFLVPTLEGQYIMKNLVLIGAVMALVAMIRSAGISANHCSSHEKK